jgi:hypothetical protein
MERGFDCEGRTNEEEEKMRAMVCVEYTGGRIQRIECKNESDAWDCIRFMMGYPGVRRVWEDDVRRFC